MFQQFFDNLSDILDSVFGSSLLFWKVFLVARAVLGDWRVSPVARGNANDLSYVARINHEIRVSPRRNIW